MYNQNPKCQKNPRGLLGKGGERWLKLQARMVAPLEIYRRAGSNYSY
jgi:hypothetical protein